MACFRWLVLRAKIRQEPSLYQIKSINYAHNAWNTSMVVKKDLRSGCSSRTLLRRL